MKLNTEVTIADIATVITAILALIFSCMYSCRSEALNELSVSPYLDISYTFVKSEGDNMDSFVYGIRTDNPGLGPAIIEKLKVSITENGHTKTSDNWNDLVEALGLGPNDSSYTTFKDGNALKAGRDLLPLFYVKPDTPESKKLYSLIIDKSLDVKIYYKSLNGDSYVSSLQSGRSSN